MKFTFSGKLIKESGLTVQEFLIGLVLKSGDKNINDILRDLVEKKKVVIVEGEYRITYNFSDLLSTILLDSDKNKEDPKRISELVKKLQLIFPSGKKEGTVYYWRGNTAEITLKLKTFFKKYGKDFTDTQILSAAQRYVEGRNGQYQYMQLLKYFILKTKRNMGGDVEEISELLSYIQNEGQDTDLSDNWTSQMI